MKWEYKTAVFAMAGFLGGKVPETDLEARPERPFFRPHPY
jgi:hypothetical protein